MNIIRYVKQVLKPYYHALVSMMKWKRRIGLHCKDFSIISNNCTGGYVYQYYGISYKTPTEGIGLSIDDYLKLINRPEHYFKHSLTFIEPSITPRYKEGEHFSYPVACIDDIIVYFRHYSTPEIAADKWLRRSSRINYGKLFFLLTESETMRDEHLEIFSKFIDETGKKGVLLTNIDKNLPHVKYVPDVPRRNSVLMWKPEIVMSTLNWKRIINSL